MHPVVAILSPSECTKQVQELKLSEDVKAKFLAENARRVFRID
jgi:predicted TIM-barrel fold metal-dependent hydrolase